MEYSNNTEFYISLAMFALMFIGFYLAEHKHEKAGMRILTPLLLFMAVSVVLCAIAFILLLFRVIFI